MKERNEGEMVVKNAQKCLSFSSNSRRRFSLLSRTREAVSLPTAPFSFHDEKGKENEHGGNEAHLYVEVLSHAVAEKTPRGRTFRARWPPMEERERGG